MGNLSLSGSVVLASLSLVIAAEARAQGPEQNYLMAALGDSISAGLLADTSLSWFNSTVTSQESPLALLASSFDIAKYKTPWDPIETLETRYELSWTTGRWIQSHFNLLTQYINQTEPGEGLTALNLAKSGGLSADVASQAKQLLETMQTGQYKSLKYVTLLVGDNDACYGVADSTMSQNLNETFKTLSQIQQADPIRILVSGLPRIPDVGQPSFLNAKTIFDLSCSTMRLNLLKECPALTSASTTDVYNQRLSSVADKNQVIASAVEQATSLYPNLQIAFSDVLFSRPLSLSELAIDCFHPNAVSQQFTSASLWSAQPWFH